MIGKMANQSGYVGAALAHELGHAKELEGSKRQKLRLHLYGNLALPASVGGSGLAWWLKKKGFRGAPVSSRTAALLGGGLALAGYGPKLYEEYRASKHAKRGLAQLVSPEDVKKASNSNKLALGTYLLGAAGSTLGAAAWGIRNPKLSGRLGVISLGTMVPQILLGHYVGSTGKKDLKLSSEQANKLRSIMGVKSSIIPHAGPAHYRPSVKGGPGAVFVPYVGGKS